jgi:hypothetical protein
MSKKATINSVISVEDGPKYTIKEILDIDTYTVIDEIAEDSVPLEKVIDKIEDTNFLYMAADKKGVVVTFQPNDPTDKSKIFFELDKPNVFIGKSIVNSFGKVGAVKITIEYTDTTNSNPQAKVQIFVGQYS